MPSFLYPAAHAPDVGNVAPSTASPSARADQFVAVTGPESEQVSASAMVVAAYGLFWLAVFVIVFMTFRSQGRLVARIDELEKRLPKDDKRP